jgi:hypothetical protein
MCTSSGDRKILITVCHCVPWTADSIRVTRPSAGETITSGSVGGIRLGSRKKNAMKSAITRRKAATYQKPNTPAATLNSSGTKMYGMLSLTIPNVFLCNHSTALPRSVQLLAPDVKGDAYFWFHVPFNFLARRNWQAVSVTQALRFLILQHH